MRNGENTFLKKLGDYTPCFEFVSVLLPSNCDKVLGKMWRYTQMRDGVCNVARERMAKELGISDTTVDRCIKVLKEKEYIIDMTPGLRNHTHTYIVDEDKILKDNEEFQKNRKELVIQIEAVPIQNELPTNSNWGLSVFNLNDEDRRAL